MSNLYDLGPVQRGFLRWALTACLLPILAWVFVEELCSGVMSAFGDAWRQARINFADYKRFMAELKDDSEAML